MEPARGHERVEITERGTPPEPAARGAGTVAARDPLLRRHLGGGEARETGGSGGRPQTGDQKEKGRRRSGRWPTGTRPPRTGATERSALFASGARRRARTEAGIRGAASARDADDLIRDVAMFLRLRTHAGPRAGPPSAARRPRQ